MCEAEIVGRSAAMEQEEECSLVPDLASCLRFGGAQADEDDAEKKKREERERKKAEVRKRLEESGKMGKKKKKGFLTPERKKKLRKVLMMKAADALKAEGLEKEKARADTLKKRTIALPDLDTIDDHGKLDQIAADMYKRWLQLEGEKYDIQSQVRQKDAEINELSITVNDLKGKFVKPTLKKVSKYDNKFKKMAKQAGEKAGEKLDFKANLKKAKKEENVIDAIMQKTKKEDKPDWSKAAKAKIVGESDEHERDEKSEAAEAPPAAAEEAEEPAAEGEEEEEEEEEEE